MLIAATYLRRCRVVGTLVGLCLTSVNSAFPADQPVELGRRIVARDTLRCGGDASADARNCLAGLQWKPEKFEVYCEASTSGHGDCLVRFPSPIKTGNETNDLVAMEWYAARDADQATIRAPAVVVVHESGRDMPIGRMIARGLQSQQLHALLIQLPGYGVRRSPVDPSIADMFTTLRQAVADVRRARDVAAALPHVDNTVIGLQGTSLGGFVTATVAGLDRGYDRTFILLAGGNLVDVIQQGAKDAAQLREQLKKAGIDGDRLRTLTGTVEPLRLAHRIDPQTTWLYSGQYDDVVPPASSRALAEAASLPGGHHIELPVDHYTGIVLLPKILLEMHQHMVTPKAGE